jgi:hypothetical protein
MFLVSFFFRLCSGTMKVLGLVFCGLLFADYANQKLDEARQTLSQLSWQEVEPQLVDLGTVAFYKAKSQGAKLIAAVTEPSGGLSNPIFNKNALSKYSQRQSRDQSPYRF